MSVIFRTGFEMGSVSGLIPEGRMSGSGVFTASSSNPKTGSYSGRLSVSDGWVEFVVGSQTDIYFACFLRKDTKSSNTGYTHSMRAMLDDDEYFGIDFNPSTGRWQASVGSTVVASSALSVPISNWHHIECRLTLHGTTGRIQLYVEGILEIDFVGNTIPAGSSATEINELRMYLVALLSTTWYIDDLWIDDAGYPGTRQCTAIKPDGDTATEDWTPSTGSDSYALLDEVPPSDTDYITSTVNGDQTIVSLEAYDDTGKEIDSVTLWVRAKKDEAAAHQIKIIDDDGSNTNVGSAEDILTTSTYVAKHLPLAPDGGAWSDTKVDALNIGVESVIV